MRKFVLSFFVFFVLKANAQVIVSAPDGFDEMEATCQQYIAKNNTQKGFRLQLGTASTRNEAQLLKSKIANDFPHFSTYVVYKQPTFRVRLGDFKNRWEANKAFIEVKNVYPSAFIVPDDIEINMPQVNKSINE